MVSARFTLRNRLQLDDTLIPAFSLLFKLPTRALPSTIPAILPFVDDLLYVSNVTKSVLPLVHV